ncbi:hypothetical protein [Streptomyces europaeiscabiei]|uniref:hypothetical protein n=1 Tax=Streptomyces europaeiscabiei TaxID=146819 RepID=UPI001ABF303D|nr:hypothetical protein [Streptomyces europaeiscabiei]
MSGIARTASAARRGLKFFSQLLVLRGDPLDVADLGRHGKQGVGVEAQAGLLDGVVDLHLPVGHMLTAAVEDGVGAGENRVRHRDAVRSEPGRTAFAPVLAFGRGRSSLPSARALCGRPGSAPIRARRNAGEGSFGLVRQADQYPDRMMVPACRALPRFVERRAADSRLGLSHRLTAVRPRSAG